MRGKISHIVLMHSTMAHYFPPPQRCIVFNEVNSQGCCLLFEEATTSKLKKLTFVIQGSSNNTRINGLSSIVRGNNTTRINRLSFVVQGNSSITRINKLSFVDKRRINKLSNKVATPHESTDYYLMSKEITTPQKSINYHLLSKKVVAT
jgi:hypothetical protein